MPRAFLLLLFFASLFSAHAQDGMSKPELYAFLSRSQPDTVLIDVYNEFSWPVYSYDLPDSSIYFANKAIALSEKIGDTKRLSIAHRRLGITYTNIGDVKSSIHHQQLSYDLSEKIGYKRGMQLALNNIGVAYLNHELLNKALAAFHRCLKVMEETGDFSNAASVYFNCALIYRRTEDLEKSKVYFFKARNIAVSRNDSNMIAFCNSNISATYRNMNRLDSARYYTQEAAKFITVNAPTNTRFTAFLNEGLILSKAGQHTQALETFLRTVPLAVVASDEITVLINIAEEYKKLGDRSKAMLYFNKAYKLSERTRTYNNLSYLTYAMATLYQEQNNLEQFAEMIKLHLSYKDSNEKYNRVQQIQQQQLEFDYERKQIADSIRFVNREHIKNMELAAAEARLTKERSFRVMLFIILGIIILFAVFIFNRFMITRKQKHIIELQKQVVEQKNQEILDSINYSKRLQAAILPQMEEIKKALQLEIFYLPRDIIGGDFYFFEKYEDKIFFAICDCTGHGIPGALMSVVCHNALQKSIKEFGLSDPGPVLDKARQIVIESLKAENRNIRDGMDCSLLVIDRKTGYIHWAGANNHLWMINSEGFSELKADKQPVALHESAKEFTSQQVKVPGDTLLYLFTDGYGDQFGGPKGKKYKSKTLKEFLISISSHPVEKQAELLRQNFKDWKADQMQVDDVTIAVIRL